MKKKEKRMILILAIITILVIGIWLFVSNNKEEQPKQNTQIQQNEVEEFVQETSDGTKINTSNKLKETKNFDGMEIKDLQLSEQNNVSKLIGTIENKSSSVKGGYAIRIYVLDKEGDEIVTVGGYIKELQPGETTRLNCSATFDYANAYDIKIKKK